MKVVFDSNVLIAAFITQGLCHAVFEQCLSDHQIYVSDTLLKELTEKLDRKLHVSEKKLTEVQDVLKKHAHKHIPVEIDPIVCRDPKDLHVLGLAVAAESDALITGDHDLLVIKKFRGIPILSPREFYTFLQKRHV